MLWPARTAGRERADFVAGAEVARAGRVVFRLGGFEGDCEDERVTGGEGVFSSLEVLLSGGDGALSLCLIGDEPTSLLDAAAGIIKDTSA